MIFSEIYGEYFNAVAKILDTAVRGELNENDIISIVGKSAFGESILSLPQKNKKGKVGTVNVRFENSDKKQTADAVDRYGKKMAQSGFERFESEVV